MTDAPYNESAALDPQQPGAARTLMGNLAAGFRLAFFLPVRSAGFRISVNQAVLSAVAMIATPLLIQLVMVLPRPGFNASGMGPIAANYACFLLGIWAISVFARSPQVFLSLVVMLTSAQTTLLVVTWSAIYTVMAALDQYATTIGVWSVFGCAMLWQMLIGLRAVRLVLETRLWGSLAMSGVYLAIVLIPMFAIPQSSTWYQRYDHEQLAEADVAAPEPIDVERTFYAQHAMVDRSLAGIEPGRPGISDLYFVGFAGYGAQDVFMNEVKVANGLFDQQFDTEGRSLSLVNNRQTIDNLPLANVSNLRLVLNGLAERMDREDDILFLFLTSHGSENELSTSFWPLQHNSLEPTALRSMLDEAGIEWRVIVVSACYSGSFIDELRSDRTLVITASRADRNSFGCSNDADMTYFGRALIDEALRETRSFTTAYDLSAQSVAAREKAEELTPSEPQISIGDEIKTKLADLTERLELLGEVAASN